MTHFAPWDERTCPKKSTLKANLAKIIQVEGVGASRTSGHELVERMQVSGVQTVRKAVRRELSQVIPSEVCYVAYQLFASLGNTKTKDGQHQGLSDGGGVPSAFNTR